MIDVASANIESFQNIGDLPPNQLKNVQFIFLPLEQEGVFEVGHFIVWQKFCSSEQIVGDFGSTAEGLCNFFVVLWSGSFTRTNYRVVSC